MGRFNKTRKDIERGKKQQKFFFLVLAACGGLYFMFSLLLGDMGLVEYVKMRKTRQDLREDITQLTARNEELKGEAGVLENDLSRIEGLAREKLGLVKDGETVYQFQEHRDGSLK